MKLLNYSTTRFALILLLLLSVWALIFYFEILDEIYDSLDDGLENQKMLVIQRAQEDDSILGKNGFKGGNFSIREIRYEEAREIEDSYRDTLMYMKNEEDYEPVRLLETAFEQDGSYYKLKLITSMVEEDDLVRDLLLSLLWLYLGLIVSILILNNLLLKKVWHPFYKLLSRLKTFSIEKDDRIDFEATNIEEFRLLNSRIEQLLQKSVESYRGQKQFIENASHELQTPLAISINKLELLVESNHLKDEQLETVGAVLNNLERLTRFNKALLLLSKIENKQFPEEENVDFNDLVRQTVSDFEDLAAHKESQLTITESAEIHYTMNHDLAIILVSNLIKNALIHGGGGVEINISAGTIRVKNRGGGAALDTKMLFSRFQQAGNQRRSNGLGLAISKAIALRFGLGLTYFYEEGHVFEIGFPRV